MAKGGGGGGQEQQGSSDRSYDLLWLVGALVIAILLLWHFEKTYVTSIIFFIRLYEIKFIYFIIYWWVRFCQSVGISLPIPSVAALVTWRDFIYANYGTAVDFTTIINMSTAVGKYFLYPCIAILVGLSATLYFGGSAYRFKNVFSIGSLRLAEQENWPYIKPIIRLDLSKVDLDDAPWAMALDPMRFCKRNGLLREDVKDGKPVVFVRKGAAYRMMVMQLGPRWVGVDVLPLYLKALFAVFVARIDGNKKAADALIYQIAESADGKNLNFSGAEELLRRHQNNKHVVRTLRLHGYVTTVMASLLSMAREAGVLASAEFLWLKAIDRRMWYMLNTVGRPTAMSEIAGAHAHWLTEKKLGLPLMVPMVDEAVRGLELALSEILYKPED